jgi:tetratricopeptide (TPR) repeat protein
VLLSLGTYKRNTLWQSPDDFYLTDYQLAPENPRAMESYGLVLIKNKKFAEGEELLRKSVNKNLKSGKITVTSLNNLISVLFQQKKYQSAINTSMIALKYINKTKDRSDVLTTIAFGYIGLGYCDFSIGLSTKAIELNPNNKQALKYQRYCQKQLRKK